MKPLPLALSALLLAAAPACAQQAGETPPAEAGEPAPFSRGEPVNPGLEPAYAAQFRAPLVTTDMALETEAIAGGLEHPWAVAVLPDGAGYLVTERPGRIRHVAADGTLSEPLAGVPDVENREPGSGWPTQGGLLDLKLAPDFGESRQVYLTYAKPGGEGGASTAAARAVLSEDMTRLSDVEDIFVQAPATDKRMHFGSRIVFDGAGHAFITTGEHSSHETRNFAQQLDKTLGKVVRVNLDGSIPQDNPYRGVEGANEAVWSYGHRNIQGAAMKDGYLLTIEHGPAGGDELNLPLPTRNYGWPLVSYGQRYAGPAIGTGRAHMAGMEEPLYYWDPVIAPGDMTVYRGAPFSGWEGDLLIASLVDGGLVRLRMNGPLVVEEERLLTGLGRVRDVEVDADGSLLVLTDFEDGRLVRVTPAR